jgi:hypothetical protein
MAGGATMLGVAGTGAGLAAISKAANGNSNKDFITLPKNRFGALTARPLLTSA